MILIERAKELSDRATELGRSREVHRQAQGFADAAEEIRKATERLTPSLSFLKWFGELVDESLDALSDPQVVAAREALRVFELAAEQSPAELLNGSTYREAKSSLNSAATYLDSRAKSYWGNYLSEVEWVSADLWAHFRGHAEHGPAVREAEAQDRTFESLARSQKPLTRRDEQNGFDRLLSDRSKTLAKLPAIADEEIQVFVREASGGGASLVSLSGRVLDWLERNDLLNSYQVRRKS
jgi:hypothetical protein